MPPHPVELVAEALRDGAGGADRTTGTDRSSERSVAGAVAGLFGRLGR
jgi:hypothetical protein